MMLIAVLGLQNTAPISLAVEESFDIKLESTAILESIAAAKPEHAACPAPWAVRTGCSPASNSFCMSNSRSGKWPATRHCNRWHSSAVSLCDVSVGMHCKLVRDRAQSRLMQALTAISSMSCQSVGFSVGQSAGWCNAWVEAAAGQCCPAPLASVVWSGSSSTGLGERGHNFSSLIISRAAPTVACASPSKIATPSLSGSWVSHDFSPEVNPKQHFDVEVQLVWAGPQCQVCRSQNKSQLIGTVLSSCHVIRHVANAAACAHIDMRLVQLLLAM